MFALSVMFQNILLINCRIWIQEKKKSELILPSLLTFVMLAGFILVSLRL